MDGDAYFFLLFSATAFALGCSVASFLNVCIWRLPREESVVSPPSHCPKCNARIRWYQNVPVLSWLCLRGRCANCREPISPQYVVVELLGGVLFLLAFLQWSMPFFLHADPLAGLVPLRGFGAVAAEWLAISGLILGSFIDLKHRYLPDRVTIGGMVLGVPLSVLVPELQGESGRLAALGWSFGGLAFGFLFLWGVGAAFSKVFRKEAMGFGDVKLLGAIGAFFGPVAALFTIVLSSFVGAVAGVALLFGGKAKFGGFTEVPYGPFIAVAALAWMYWGPSLAAWYMAFFRA